MMENTSMLEAALHQHSVQMLQRQLEVKFALSVDMVSDKLQKLALPQLEALFVELFKLKTVQQLNNWLESHLNTTQKKQTEIIIISKDEWSAIQETLYLLSIPGMRESIRAGLATSVSECSTELEW